MIPSYNYQGRVRYLGVVTLHRNQANDGSMLENKIRHSVLATSKVFEPIDLMILDFLNGHKIARPGRCTIFETLEMGQKWFVLTDQETKYTYIMVTTVKDYPNNVGTRCIEELSELFMKYQRKKLPKPTNFSFGKRRRAGTQKSKKLRKQINSLVLKYDNLEEVCEIWKTRKDVEELTRKMEDNIRSVLQNTESADNLMQMSAELLEQTRVFKKRMKQLRNETSRSESYVKYATVGACVGGAAACFVCPPVGAAVLSGAGCVTIYSLLSSEAGVEFWSHAFVPIRQLDVSRFRELWMKNRNNKG